MILVLLPLLVVLVRGAGVGTVRVLVRELLRVRELLLVRELLRVLKPRRVRVVPRGGGGVRHRIVPVRVVTSRGTGGDGVRVVWLRVPDRRGRRGAERGSRTSAGRYASAGWCSCGAAYDPYAAASLDGDGALANAAAR